MRLLIDMDGVIARFWRRISTAMERNLSWQKILFHLKKEEVSGLENSIPSEYLEQVQNLSQPGFIRIFLPFPVHLESPLMKSEFF